MGKFNNPINPSTTMNTEITPDNIGLSMNVFGVISQRQQILHSSFNLKVILEQPCTFGNDDVTFFEAILYDVADAII